VKNLRAPMFFQSKRNFEKATALGVEKSRRPLFQKTTKQLATRFFTSSFFILNH
jgi:hypothetical protein